jgi:hypothetical protein
MQEGANTGVGGAFQKVVSELFERDDHATTVQRGQ